MNCTTSVSLLINRVQHDGLLYKLSSVLLSAYCRLLQSYLQDRFFRVGIGKEYYDYTEIKAGVSQDNMLRPTLYLMYTCDTIKDDSTFLASFCR